MIVARGLRREFGRLVAVDDVPDGTQLALLASPASNLAIFGGKVLGAILPPLAYSTVAEAVYLIGVGLLLGVQGPRLVPLPMPLWGVVFGLATNLQRLGAAGVFGVVVGLWLVDLGLTVLAAATRGREEVLSR